MSIPDRIGGQGVIRVLSNISGTSTAKIVDLSDIDIASLADGFVLEYNADTSKFITCLLYTSPSPRDMRRSRMPSSA